jgi:hypothetical protein
MGSLVMRELSIPLGLTDAASYERKSGPGATIRFHTTDDGKETYLIVDVNTGRGESAARTEGFVYHDPLPFTIHSHLLMTKVHPVYK